MDGRTADVPEVQPVYRALAAPGVYRELVVATGRTGEQFETWVKPLLQSAALTPGK